MTMPPVPMNVYLQDPTSLPPHWNQQTQEWIRLNTDTSTILGRTGHGHPDFYPLTIKAAYIVGLIYNICLAVTALLDNRETRREHFLIAYGVFASGIDLLGRCIQGNDTFNARPNKKSGSKVNEPLDIEVGFRWLKQPDLGYNSVALSDVLVTTPQDNYTIAMLATIRHYAAHGQATTNAANYQFRDIDYDLLEPMAPLLIHALEAYWNMLQARLPYTTHDAETLCNNLAWANITAFRNWPVHSLWLLIERHGKIAEIFRGFNWQMTGYRI